MENEVVPNDTDVVILIGTYEGHIAVVQSYEPEIDSYTVEIDGSEGLWYVRRDEFELLNELTPEDEDEEYDTPGFGMDANEFAVHLEFLIGRALDKVPTVGPEQAFFGYQEFEGLTAEEVLLRLLDKIEEGIAHLAQAHILISRIGVSYRDIMKEITDEQTDSDE